MFGIALSNVLLTLLYILPGFLLCRCRKGTAEHLPTLAAVLVYILSPCLPVSAFLDLEFSWPAFGDLMLFFALTLLLQGAFIAILFFFLRRRYDDARCRILNVGAVLFVLIFAEDDPAYAVLRRLYDDVGGIKVKRPVFEGLGYFKGVRLVLDARQV